MRSSSTVRRAALLAAWTATSLAASSAGAAGLYYADRGVRPLARGGAFVAGADDAGALMYNPAGMFDAGGQVLLDASWMHFTSDYTRQAQVVQVDPNTGQQVGAFKQTFPTVHGTTPFLPIPTLAVTFKVHEKVVLGFGAWAPYAALASYPETVDGKAAPQRYSLITLNGSMLSFLAAGVAFAPIKELRLGAMVGMLTGMFRARVAFSGCVPDRLTCAQEEPSWDALTQFNVGPIFAPTGQLGLTWIPRPMVRVGAAVQLPVYVRSGGTLNSRLPSTPLYDRAKQVGDSGAVSFNLPWTVRAGVEVRPVRDLRLEVAANFDRWSMHDTIRLEPDHIGLQNVVGFSPTYYTAPTTLPRHFKDSVAVHLGGEYRFELGGSTWDARAGAAFETSAIPTEYESALTIDQNKITAALGVSLHLRKLRFDLTYAHVFGLNVTVDPKDAKISLLSAVTATPPTRPDYINGGVYSARADVIGLGMTYTFDQPQGEKP